MTLKNELPDMIKRFEPLKNQLEDYAHKIYESKDYSDFKTRIAYDCFYAVYRGSARCNYYDYLSAKYPGYTDRHFQTLIKAALTAVYPGIDKWKD